MSTSRFTAVQNVYIAEFFPDTNFDNQNPNENEVLFVGSFGGSADIYRSLLQFDLSDPNKGIPTNCTIKSAELDLVMFRNDNVGTAKVSANRVLDSFNQSTVTFNNAPPVDPAVLETETIP